MVRKVNTPKGYLRARDKKEYITGNYQSRQQIGASEATHSYEDVWQRFPASD